MVFTPAIKPTGADPDCKSKMTQIFRQVQENELHGRYRYDADFSLKVRMVAALAFVPLDQVITAFEEM